MRKEICCVLRMVYHWQNSVLAYVTMFHPEMSQAMAGEEASTYPNPHGPPGNKLTCLPIIVLSFEPQTLLSSIHLFWGKEELRQTKAKTKGREISGQILVSGFTSSGVSIYLLILSSWRHSKISIVSLSTYLLHTEKNKRGTERKIFIIQD